MVRTSCLLSLLSGWVPIPGPGTKIPETMLCEQKKKKSIRSLQFKEHSVRHSPQTQELHALLLVFKSCFGHSVSSLP